MELKGTGVSPGIALGPALVVERDTAPVFRLSLAPEEVAGGGRAPRRAAIALSRAQLQAIKDAPLAGGGGAPRLHLRRAPPHAGRPAAAGSGAGRHPGAAVNAEWALREVSEQLHALFAQFTDAYLRERSTDLDDVLGRIQLNLRGSAEAPSLARLPGQLRARGRRPQSLGSGGAGLGARAGGGHGRGLVDLPHRDHRPLAGHPGGGRAQGRDARGQAGSDGSGGRYARGGGGRAVGARPGRLPHGPAGVPAGGRRACRARARSPRSRSTGSR